MIRVYYIDDSVDEQDIFKQRLKSLAPDFEITCFDDAYGLLERLSRHSCDCIISDYKMPKMDGLELLHNLRSNNIDVPVILLTGEGGENVAANFFHAGANDYFVKDFRTSTWNHLVVSIRQNVENHSIRLEFKRKQQQLEEREDLLQTLIEESPNVICFKDGKGRWLELNRAGRNFFGLKREDYREKTPIELAEQFPHKAKMFLKSHHHDLDTWSRGEIVKSQEVFSLEDGHLEHYQVTKIPKYNSDGSKKGLILIANNISSLVDAEEALRESEEFYRALFEKSTLGVYIVSMDGIILRVNSKTAMLFDESIQNMVGRNISSYYSSQSRLSSTDMLGDLHSIGFTSGEVILKSATDRKFNALVQAHVITQKDGSSIIHGFIEDVSEKVRLEAQEDALHRLAIDLNSVESLDEMAKISLEAAVHVTECSYGGFYLKKGDEGFNLIQSFGAPEIVEQKLKHIKTDSLQAENINNGRPLFGDFRTTDTATLFREENLDFKAFGMVPLKSGKELLGFIAVISNSRSNLDLLSRRVLENIARQIGSIIKSIQIRQELKKSQEELKLTLKATETATWIWNRETNEANFNNVFFETLGYNRKELEPLTNQTWNDLLHPDDLAKCNQILEEYFQGDKHLFEAELRFVHKDGSVVWMDTHGKTSEFGKNGEPIRVLGICRNITQKKQAEEELLQSREILKSRAEELIQLNRQLEAFSYTVSHDLRAPLRHIKGFSQLLQERTSQADDETVQLTGRIIEAVSKMDQMVEAMLQLHRTAQGELDVSECNLSLIARETTEALMDSGDYTNTTVNITENLYVFADSTLIASVLQNLIGNALKYSSTSQNPEITFSSQTIDDKKTFFISDNGVGFDPARKSKLFLPFSRLHCESEFKGLGIGLASARKIVEKHGGEIWAESSPGNGATFYFTLPSVQKTSSE